MQVKENWEIKKSSVSSKGGVVSSHHFEASNIGTEILNSGGNAVDAAVAMGLALGIVEPWMSGIGGCGFMVYYDSKSQKSYSIDFGVKSPINLDTSKFKIIDDGNDDDLFGWPLVKDNINIHGPLSMAVPGYISGISNALNSFGMNLGMTFQIIDDLLDYKSIENYTGKKMGNDFAEGKVTLPIILAYHRGNNVERKFWIKTIKKSEQKKGDFEKACDYLEKRNILNDIFERAKHYGNVAKDALEIFPNKKEKKILVDLIDFILNRSF